MAMRLFLLQLQVSVAVLVILLLRAWMKRIPKVYSYGLWLLVFLRLLLPVQLESAFGLMPSLEEGEAWMLQIAENDSRADGVPGQGSSQSKTQGMVQADGSGYGTSGAAAGLGATGSNGSQTAAGGNTGTYGYQTEIEGTVGGSPDGDSAAAEVDRYTDNVSRDDSQRASRDMVNDLVYYLASGLASFFAPAQPIRRFLDVLWVAGALGVLSYNGISLIKVKRRLGGAECLSDNVYVSTNISTPFTLGLWRPRIYLPTGLEEIEQEYILCHERVHIKRKDYLVKNLAFLLTALYWFNPFVWVAFYFLERDMEMSCDEKVLKLLGDGIKRQYSQSLLNFAQGSGIPAVTPFAFGENGVKQRVKNVLSYQKAKKWVPVAGAVMLVAAVVILFTVRGSHAEPESGTEPGQDTQLADHDADDADGLESEAPAEDPDDQEQDQAGEQGAEDQSQLPDFPLIETREQFEEMYPPGDMGYDFSVVSDHYDQAFYQDILWQLTCGEEPEDYESYTNPVFAAARLLHLGAGSGTVEYDGQPMSVDGWNLTWLELMSWMGEGSMAHVTYTFDADGSQVEIPLALVEGSKSLWAVMSVTGPPHGLLQPGLRRLVYQTGKVYPDEQGEKGEIYFQTSHYGLYILDKQGLRCVYPYSLPKDVCVRAIDGLLYFDVKVGDNGERRICVLDPETGKFDQDALVVPFQASKVFPLGWISVSQGYVGLHALHASCYMPFVNTHRGPLGKEVWNGKTATELTEAETDEYGVWVRKQLLENPGMLMELSNRTLEENFVLVDLDGDGRTERVSLKQNPQYPLDYYSFYHSYLLELDGNAIEGWGENVNNNVWGVSLDGENILLALYEDGPSGDPETTLYCEENGQLREVGCFPDDIRRCTIKNGVITGTSRMDVIQTDWVTMSWRVGASGELERVPQESYEFVYPWGWEVILQVELPVYDQPAGRNSHILKPQAVTFLRTDQDEQWIYVQGEDGDGGWFRVESFNVSELELDVNEVFAGLNHAD